MAKRNSAASKTSGSSSSTKTSGSTTGSTSARESARTGVDREGLAERESERQREAASRAPARATSSGSDGENAKTGEQQALADARAVVGSAMTEDGRPVTSTSNAPGVVPVSEVAGAGADQAAGRHALRVERGLVAGGGAGKVSKDGERSGSQQAKGDMKAGELIDGMAPGTTITRSGAGVTVSTPIGGGITRSFAGANLADALAQMEAFLSGEEQAIAGGAGMTEKDRKRVERERRAEEKRERELEKDEA